jgi:hypothetical protein
MRFMVFVKGDERYEAGAMPSQDELAEMGKFNEELVKAGVMLDGDGLRPTSSAARVRYGGDKPTVTDGPFTEAKEIVAGYWVWEVKSQEEAIEWLKRAPFREGEVELRQFVQPEDFGEAFTPELREQEDRLRAEAGQRQQP